ncbi:MAG: hypothetical protein CSA34_04805 [Desulfobulbus propionicus]|nr:MAG: hypothetical protein CSA34_04805 [Desulfobulbus propionicus]
MYKLEEEETWKLQLTPCDFILKKFSETVRRSEEVVIIYQEESCASLVPCHDEKTTREQHRLVGMWQDGQATDNVEEYCLSYSMQLADACIGATAIAYSSPAIKENDTEYKRIKGLQIELFRP